MQIQTKEQIVKTYSAILPNGKEITAKTEEALRKKLEEENKKQEQLLRQDVIARAIDPYFPIINRNHGCECESYSEASDGLTDAINSATNTVFVGIYIESKQKDKNLDPVFNWKNEFTIQFTDYTLFEKIRNLILDFVAKQFASCKFSEKHQTLDLELAEDPFYNDRGFEKFSPQGKAMAFQLKTWLETDFLNEIKNLINLEVQKQASKTTKTKKVALKKAAVKK